MIENKKWSAVFDIIILCDTYMVSRWNFTVHKVLFLNSVHSPFWKSQLYISTTSYWLWIPVSVKVSIQPHNKSVSISIVRTLMLISSIISVMWYWSNIAFYCNMNILVSMLWSQNLVTCNVMTNLPVFHKFSIILVVNSSFFSNIQ